MKLLEFMLDTLHAAFLYPSGLTQPRIARGYFTPDESGAYQRIFFDELLAHGFSRTPFQLIFPGQTAGLIRKIEPPQEGMDEIHIRFYEDGVIAAELEYGRFSLGHWREERASSVSVLEELLDQELSSLAPCVQEGIRKQFQDRDYSIELTPSKAPLQEHPFSKYLHHLGLTAFLTIQTPLTALSAAYYFSKGEMYHALEPALWVLIVDIPFLAITYSSLRYKDHLNILSHVSPPTKTI